MDFSIIMPILMTLLLIIVVVKLIRWVLAFVFRYGFTIIGLFIAGRFILSLFTDIQFWG